MQRLFLHWNALGQAVEEMERPGLGGETRSSTGSQNSQGNTVTSCVIFFNILLGLTVCGGKGFILGTEAAVDVGGVGEEQHRHQVGVTCNHLHSRLLSAHPNECAYTHTYKPNIQVAIHP